MTVRLIRASLSAPAHCGATVGLTVLSSFRAPVSDDINFDTFELKKDALAADGFVWKLWYHYDPSPRAWIDLGDASVPMTQACGGKLIRMNCVGLVCLR